MITKQRTKFPNFKRRLLLVSNNRQRFGLNRTAKLHLNGLNGSVLVQVQVFFKVWFGG